jgi:hypothetical protein
VNEPQKVHVDPSGAPQTMLATLYASSYRLVARLMSVVPPLHMMAQFHRYAF